MTISRLPARHRRRSAFTLLEVLIATAVTLLMMLSLAQIFAIVGDSMKQGRAGLELNNRLRSVAFRLRNDLNNLTVRVRPPADVSSGTGYFEYYDGPMTDYSCMLFDPNNAFDLKVASNTIRSSRIGDMDDILMYTARAGDSWFTGKVPAFVLNPSILTTDVDGDGTIDGQEDSNGNGVLDGIDPVIISSQHAEIAVFARPTGDADGDGIPDGFQLYYRTLLIRPDLNIEIPVSGSSPVTGLPFTDPASTYGPNLIAGAQAGLPTPTCDMALAHQQCDLSIRRVFNGTTSPAYDYVAANSLEDLMDPANRFAHIQLQIPGTPSTSMPLLALTEALPFLVTGSLSTPPPHYLEHAVAIGSFPVGSGFLHPAFTLGNLTSTTIDDVRIGEDVLASDVLAFDAKAFDTGVPVLTMYGPDGIAGTSGTNPGADGSDDIVVTPNDPGYGPALVASSASPAQAIIAGNGAYVDLMWGRKMMSSLSYFGMGASSLPATSNLWTELSGYSNASGTAWNTGASPVMTFSAGLAKSGKVIRVPGAVEPPLILQPTYDSWTTKYEGDGYAQAERTGNVGIVRINGMHSLYNSSFGGNDTGNMKDSFRINTSVSPNVPLADIGSDGIDNNGVGGIDEITESETLPPFPTASHGVKISIRLHDRATRQIKQMSVANEFMTQ